MRPLAFGFRWIAAIIAVSWCTHLLKIKSSEEFVGEDKAYNYIVIRADEDRVGYNPLKNVELRNIDPKYPFRKEVQREKNPEQLELM